MIADFYVQDERYAALTRMWRSSDVQDERYAALKRMWRSSDVQNSML